MSWEKEYILANLEKLPEHLIEAIVQLISREIPVPLDYDSLVREKDTSSQKLEDPAAMLLEKEPDPKPANHEISSPDLRPDKSHKIIIQTNSQEEMEQIIQLLADLNAGSLKITATSADSSITPGDKSIDPSELFGMWKDKPRTLEQIRKEGWKRDWN